MTIILLFLSGCLLIYLGFVLRNAWYFVRIPSSESSTSRLPKVSLIIPARNEEDSVSQCLQSAIAQQYPPDLLEILLINDHSEDHTEAIAKTYFPDNPQLQILLNEGQGKKAAIATGIRHSTGEIILQTDADCTSDPEWVISMVRYFSDETAMVSGPVRLNFQPSVFQQLQALESMGLIGLGAGSIARGRPNMCNGANLAYRKSVFLQVNGFEGIDQVASGDDELLLQKIHLAGYEIRFARDPKAIVSTPAMKNWLSFKRQRLRWVSKARAYIDKSINRIQLISYLGFCLFPALIIAGSWNPVLWWGILFGLLVKSAADYPLMNAVAEFFDQKKLLKWLPLLEIVYIPYVLWIGIAGNLLKHYQWKGRKVK